MKINHLFDAKLLFKYGQQKGWEAQGAYGSRINLCQYIILMGKNKVHLLVEKRQNDSLLRIIMEIIVAIS